MPNNNSPITAAKQRIACGLDTLDNASIRQHTRRGFLVNSLVLSATCALLPVAQLTAPSACASDVSPDASASEIAALGTRLREIDPATAGQLETLAREVAGLTAAAPVDWAIADKARLKLTEHTRVAYEVRNEQVVFVDGWLLTRSEAAAALLYAAASSAPADHAASPVAQ